MIPASGEIATLDTTASRIWLNASLNSVNQVLTNWICQIPCCY